MSSDHPGVLYFYSESAGLGANALCALLAALSNLLVGGSDNRIVTATCYLLVGGLVQLICAIRAFRAYDHFGATLFGFFAGFWALFGWELLTQSSIHWLHIALLVTNVSFMAVAPLVNAYYTCAVASIALASGLELAARLLPSDGNSAVQQVAGVAELLVVLVTGYGSAAAILHGVHQRQVFVGFEDALVETVLWKRRPLRSKYSDGKWANPKPLGLVCLSMGTAGIAARFYAADDAIDDIDSIAMAFWLAMFAAGLWVVSLLHALRHEQLWSVSSLCDACLLAVTALHTAAVVEDNNGMDDSELELMTLNGGILLGFFAARVLLLCFAVVEGFAAVDVCVLGMMVLSLLTASIQAFTSSSAAIVGAEGSAILFSLTAGLALYSGIAELANAVAQKIALPLGPPFFRGNNLVDTSHFDAASRMNYKHQYPGDTKLPGSSDFQTPLFVMLVGVALYAMAQSAAIFGNSNLAAAQAAQIVLMTQVSTVLICASRGQTSFGFCSFSYLLEAVTLAGFFSSEDFGSYPSLMIGIVLLQFVWLLSSFSVFGLLSAITALHCAGILLCLGLATDPLRYASAALFTLMSIVSLFALAILFGIPHFQWCLRWTQISCDDEGPLCETGFAHDRAMFEKCIKILKEGGVCCIPTDTVYCLACAADRPDAIKRIYDIKNRPSEKPLSLWLGSIDDIKKVAPEGKGWGPKLFQFMDSIWPGSVSLVVSRGSWLRRMGIGSAADLIGTPDSIALRVPNSTLTVALLQETGPLAITSANPSGACDCTHHNKVDDVIASKIDFILADGSSPMTIASSVVDVRDIEASELFFYRVGCVPEAYIWEKVQICRARTVPPPVFATIPRSKIKTVENMMSMIAQLLSCDKWQIFLLRPSMGRDVDVLKIDSEEKSATRTLSWEETVRKHGRVTNTFLSGVSYYNTDTCISASKTKMGGSSTSLPDVFFDSDSDAEMPTTEQVPRKNVHKSSSETSLVTLTDMTCTDSDSISESQASIPNLSSSSYSPKSRASSHRISFTHHPPPAKTPTTLLIVPVVYHGNVCAVLQFLNKRSGQDLVPFVQKDLVPTQLACNQLLEMIKVREEEEVTISPNECVEDTTAGFLDLSFDSEANQSGNQNSGYDDAAYVFNSKEMTANGCEAEVEVLTVNSFEAEIEV